MTNSRIYIFSLIMALGCVEPFEPVIPMADRQYIVVDGIITDQPGPYQVKLTRTVSLDSESSKGTSINNATVRIESGEGDVDLLVPIGNGRYQTTNIRGVIGGKYKLNFSVEGQTYESNWESILESSNIDSVSYDRQVDLVAGEEGIQFYVTNSGNPEAARFYRYEWEETWQITVEYRALYDYLGGDKVAYTTNPLYDCWKYDSSRVINLGSTQGLADNKLYKHKIPFVFGDDERFTERYSLNLKQFGLNEEEYAFWKLLQESNQEGGSLFDKQPANVTGNIKNIDDPEDVVLGYFSASSLKEERLFLRQQYDISQRILCPTEPTYLFKSTLGPAYENTIYDLLDKGMIFYRVISVPQAGVIGSIFTTTRCSDCRTKGGFLSKPEFWDE